MNEHNVSVRSPEQRDPHNGSAIEIKGLTKNYGDTPALRGLNMTVPTGVTFGFLGPNGAGKTTSVKILCGALKQSGGEAYIFGDKIEKAVNKMVGYMPQELALYLDLTVNDNLEFYGSLYGMKKEEIERKGNSLLLLLGLSERKTERVTNLSGGLRRRVSLACALIHEPRLLILDEPTVGIDPELRQSFWEYFNKLKQAGTTIVITTHYMDEAGKCDLVGFIRDGVLLAKGSPDEILERTHSSSFEEAYLYFSHKKGGE